MSVLIISSVLLVTVLSLAQYGIANRYSLLDLERKTESKWLAEACVEWVRIAIANEPTLEIDTPEPVDVGGGKTCTVEFLSPNTSFSGPGRSEARISATSTKAFTNLRATIDSTDATLTTLEEIPNIPII
jgi:hypothetical protein